MSRGSASVGRNLNSIMKRSTRVVDESMFIDGDAANGVVVLDINNTATRHHHHHHQGWIYNVFRAPMLLLSCFSNPHAVDGVADGVWVSSEFGRISEMNHLMVNDSMRYAILM
uniref:Uncharacterized protein n=1 Tax=Kalanchoe fedtschenkoi TaxID=63787 RepID=A0A7N0TU32_KALFE